MDYLFANWDRLKEKFKNKEILLFLDYDGTLTPIVATPQKALISGRIKELLRRLSKNPRFKLVVISGRSLKNIKSQVGLKNIIYSGNHGLEIEGPKIKFVSPVSPAYKGILRQIKNDLEKRSSSIRGVLVEDKGLSLSFHYRLVDKKDIPLVKTIFHKAIILYLARKKIKVKSGKMVYEVRPPIEWDKGKAVMWLLQSRELAASAPIYIGDDITDEDAFKALKNRGLSVFVGTPKASYANYYLKNTQEVTEFLRRILKEQKARKICRN